MWHAERKSRSSAQLHMRYRQTYGLSNPQVRIFRSHYYHNPEFTEEENQRVFGKCANLNGHGHNYTLEVTVKGEVDPRTGFVVDLKDLKEILNREVLEALDHRHLNKEVPEFAQQIPTTENLAIAIWKRLESKLNVAQAASRARLRTA